MTSPDGDRIRAISDGPVPVSEQPVLAELIAERGILPRLQDQDPYFVERIALDSRVLIIEGISGSGKDTFQTYLKKKLKGRVVHDYSEGELLWSWKHQQIKDIFKMQIRLMRNFLDYVAVTLERDDKALFLLNRFHLSTYTMYTTGITGQATLEREYNMVIKALRALPTHVFLLQLMEGEMEARSSHPERGVAWRRFQQHIFEREGFGNFVKRNVTLQKAMIETAIRQNIPFSILRLPSSPNLGIAVRRSPNAKITANLDAALDPLSEKLNPRSHPPGSYVAAIFQMDDDAAIFNLGNLGIEDDRHRQVCVCTSPKNWWDICDRYDHEILPVST